MATIYSRKNKDEEWTPATPFWKDISEERAHKIADRYNKVYDHAMWWVSTQGKPSSEAAP